MAAWVGWLHLPGHPPWRTLEKFDFVPADTASSNSAGDDPCDNSSEATETSSDCPAWSQEGMIHWLYDRCERRLEKTVRSQDPMKTNQYLARQGIFVRHVGPSWSGHNWDSRTSSTSLGGYHWPFKWWRFSHSQYRWTPGCHELEAFHNHCHSFRAWGSNHELVWLRHGELEVFWRWFLSQHLCWPCGQWRLGNTRGTGFAGQSCQCISLQQTFQFKQELQSPRCTRIFRLSACCW